MKKLICALVVLVMASPVWADVNITASVVVDACEPNKATVTVTFDASGESNNVRAYAVDITLEGDAAITDVTCADNGYYVYPGSIAISSSGEVDDWGSCLCDSSYAGTQQGLDSNGVTVEMGSLYEDGQPAPADVNTMVVLDIVGCGDVNVVVALNAIRGGVVMENPDEPVNVNLTGDSCTLVCGWWYPPCWDDPQQCHGDADGDGDVDTVDWPGFRDGFGKSCPDPDYRPCADFDRDGDIDTVDWPQFRDWFGNFPPADCIPGDINEVYKPGGPCAP